MWNSEAVSLLVHQILQRLENTLFLEETDCAVLQIALTMMENIL